MEPTTIPNHHAAHPPFRGPLGLVAALSMAVGRDDETRLAAELTALGPTDHLVDIGCGAGAAIRLGARTAATAIGVDPAPVMLRVARLTAHRDNVTWVEGTAERLPLEDGSATVIWALATVHHWAAPDDAARDVCRVLAAGGRFVAIEAEVAPDATGHRSHGWTRPQAEAFGDMCTAAGLAHVSVSRHHAGRRAVLAVVGRSPIEPGPAES